MVFSSSLFLLGFLPIFMLLYVLSKKHYQNKLILWASLLFYAWGEPKFIFVLLISTVIDFHLVAYMHKQKGRFKKTLLWLSIGLNLGLLFYFKYFNFFMESVGVSWREIALPIGISFYTFQTLTYSVDVYRGVAQPLERLGDYLLYILMFPQLIAGPIVRFNTIASQIKEREVHVDHYLQGIFRFIIGLSKKVLIANVLGEFVDAEMSKGDLMYNSGLAWSVMFAYALQLYFDFSGYSDMAIGLGRFMGFTFPENFDSPYVSRSITEFWKRWYMTLGAWMKDYLYIPLGGNQRRVHRNLILVFLLSGLWHGASWNFVLWGAFHGTFLLLDRLFLKRVLKRLGVLAVPFTFCVVLLGWVLFRVENLGDAANLYKSMFQFKFESFGLTREVGIVLVVGACFSVLGASRLGKRWQDSLALSADVKPLSPKRATFNFLCCVSLLLCCVSSITTMNFNPFIYLRF